MAKNKINLPMSQGGLTRFFEGKSSLIDITPEMVLAATIIFAVALIIAHKINILGF